MKLSIRPATALFALLVGAGVLVSCGGNELGFCNAPTGQVALVYPAPGSTAIPDNFPGVIFGSTNGLPSSYVAVLQKDGTTLQVPQLRLTSAPVPLPTPNVIPSFPNPIYQLSGLFRTLSGGTKYQVFLYNDVPNCKPAYMGYFTSQ